MDKKQFDHIEKDMRTAAEGWEPAFDEKAWDRMEQMLEGENDRKKRVAWWTWLLPLLLVIGIGSYFIVKNNKPPTTAFATAQAVQSQKDNGGTKNQTDIEEQPTASMNKTDGYTVPAGSSSYTSRQGNSMAAIRMKIKVLSPTASNDQPDEKDLSDRRKISDQQKRKMNMGVNAAIAVADDDDKYAAVKQDDKPGNNEPAATSIPATESPVLKKEEARQQINTGQQKEKDNNTPTNKKAKKQEGKSSKFYFSLFAGMEGNGVNFPGLNKVSPRAGFTAGYHLTKQLSVQAGFFAGSKKYVAGKYDYNPKPGTYWSMVDIQNVDANCRVFEIPLSVRYDFTPAKKWNTFLSGGLSSYIMDKEDYAYDYIRNNTAYYAKASYTGNQHLFSVLRISGGVEKKLSNQISLGINPGLAIPLAGVGEGKIKLFSSEVLLSVKYRPFKKSK